jgi:NAD(P)-dependent dehydrogenase (short-subunit alcohol dehydrogenase family)
VSRFPDPSFAHCIGIGKETARVLALRGSRVIIGCRDQTKGNAAVADIVADTGVAADLVECIPLDLTSFESIRAFAAAFLAKDLQLNLLILNAGVMAPEWGLTKEGFETTFGVNHIGHFLLTSLLMEKLKTSAPSRIVSLASMAHKWGTDAVLNVVREEKDYSPWTAYYNAKLANVLFALELNRRLQGTNVSVNSVHPGVIATELARSSTGANLMYKLGGLFMKSIPQGAATTLFVATHSSVTPENSGKYYADSQVAETTSYGKDLDLASRLWALSEQLTGITFLAPPAEK